MPTLNSHIVHKRSFLAQFAGQITPVPTKSGADILTGELVVCPVTGRVWVGFWNGDSCKMVTPYSRDEITQGSGNYTYVTISDSANYTDGGKLRVEGTGKFAFQNAPYLESILSAPMLGTDATGRVQAVTSAPAVTITARNNTGSQINKGQAVRISGAQGQNPTISLAQANAYATTDAIGLAAANIGNNSTGSVIIAGTLTNLDTSAFNDGDTLYLSATTAGALQNTDPLRPNWQMQMGYVEYAHPTQGKILVHANLESTKTEYITDMTEAGVALATLAPMAEGSVLARQQGGGAGNPSALNLGYALTAVGSLAVGLNYYNNVLGSTVTMTNANTWYNGPFVTLNNGVWLVQANLTLQKGALTGTNPFAIRITNTTTVYASSQMAWATTASIYGSIDCSCIITITGGLTNIYAQAASAYAGGNIATAITLVAAGSASQITAVRIA